MSRSDTGRSSLLVRGVLASTLAIGAAAFAPAPVAPLFVVGTDVKQAANFEGFPGHINWVSGLLTATNSIYAEGMSVPVRLTLTSIPATPGNQHVLNFRLQATRAGGEHVYDFLTSWNQAIQAADGQGPGGEDVLDTLSDPAVMYGPNYSTPGNAAICQSLWDPAASPVVALADLPDALGMIGGGTMDVASQITSYEASRGNRQVVVRAPIGNGLSGVSLVFMGYSGGPEIYADYELHWTSSSPSIGIEMASHLATGNPDGVVNGYGALWGAAAMPSGMYHLNIPTMDGVLLGNLDLALKAADVLMEPAGPWVDVGFALAGTSGKPSLVGSGTLGAAAPGSLTLAGAKPSAICTLHISVVSTPVPFKQGTLVAFPPVLNIPLITSAAGTVKLPFTWPNGVPSGASLWFQFSIADAAAVAGVSLSNALKATTP